MPLLATTPYIHKVYSFSPAPGQFVNVLPQYAAGDDSEAMRQKAEEAIAENNQGMISLGGWGGYVVFGFDHIVPNVAGEYDFVVYGNAFYSDAEHPEKGGSAEPGIVCVSYDANGNGEPDDPWYELAGSAYTHSVKNYQITYSRPAVDTLDIPWTDNQCGSGAIAHNKYHAQAYYPQWLGQQTMTYSGTRLPDNARNDEGVFVLSNFEYGYADNHPNNVEAAQLKIDWALKDDGTPANLTGIHFVKVYTGVNQQCGSIGETSTEVTGAMDLHWQTAIDEIQTDDTWVQVLNLSGQTVFSSSNPFGEKRLPASLPSGIYVLRTLNQSIKIIINH